MQGQQQYLLCNSRLRKVGTQGLLVPACRLTMEARINGQHEHEQPTPLHWSSKPARRADHEAVSHGKLDEDGIGVQRRARHVP